MLSPPKRLIVAITGASGTVYGVRLLEALKDSGVETHLVMSDAAKLTMAAETDYTPDSVSALASAVHAPKNIGAAIASGSFLSLGMVVAPCSVHTMSEIAWGQTDNLISRAADVILKERLRTEPYGFFFRKNDPEFKSIVDQTLTKLMKSGEMETLYSKWFTKPVPPKGVNLNFPMTDSVREIYANPNNKGI